MSSFGLELWEKKHLV